MTTETWLPFAVKHPGPVNKLGYGGVKYRQLGEIEGEVKHSTEGSLQAAFGELDKLTRGASWHGTIDHDGTLYQHYPLEAICWHAGDAGDRSHDTSLLGNLTLLGWEHVDRINGVQLATLTPAAEATTIRITEFVRTHCSSVGANPPTWRVNLWKHGMLSATACDSGLTPLTIIQGLEDDMGVTEDIAAIKEELAKQSAINDAQTQTDEAVKAVLAEHDGRLDTLEAQAPASHTHDTGPPK